MKDWVLALAAMTLLAAGIAVLSRGAEAGGAGMDAMSLDMDPASAAANLNPVAENAGAGHCDGNADNDGDGWVNDGCSIVDNGDTILDINDAETPAQCTNNADNDGDTVVNDGCTARTGTLSTIQPCARINENNQLDADEDAVDAVNIDVTALNIPDNNGMVAYNFKINYDDNGTTGLQLVSPGGNPAAQLLVANADSSLFGVSDPLPDNTANGEYNASTLDTGITWPESGTGIMHKLRVASRAGTPAGDYPLVLSNAVHIDRTNTAQFPDITGNAVVSVNQACPAAATPTPSPTPTLAPTPSSSPTAAPTPAPSSSSTAAPTPDGSPSASATPSPTGAGSPGPTDTGGPTPTPTRTPTPTPTDTGSGTPTALPTPTATPPPTGSPPASPTPDPTGGIPKGSVDCDADVDAIDGLHVLRHVAQLGDSACIADADMDCDGDRDALDALKILRHVAGLPTLLPEGCPPIGSVT